MPGHNQSSQTLPTNDAFTYQALYTAQSSQGLGGSNFNEYLGASYHSLVLGVELGSPHLLHELSTAGLYASPPFAFYSEILSKLLRLALNSVCSPC